MLEFWVLLSFHYLISKLPLVESRGVVVICSNMLGVEYYVMTWKFDWEKGVEVENFLEPLLTWYLCLEGKVCPPPLEFLWDAGLLLFLMRREILHSLLSFDFVCSH